MVLGASPDPRLENCVLADDEMLMIEDADEYINPLQIVSRRLDIALHRKNRPQLTKFAVRQVFNAATGCIRPIDLLSPVRGELELEAFGRAYLTEKLVENVRSFPLVIFVDDFGLYRNMYRSVTGVYAMPAGLSIEDRQRSSNAYTVTFGPHGSDFDEVMGCLQTSLGALDWGSVFEMNGRKQSIWAPVLGFIGDMKQQAVTAGFLGARAKFSCRFCDAGLNNRGDLMHAGCFQQDNQSRASNSVVLHNRERPGY